jgi:tetratricopeptide (TPR) repeat protein
VRKRSSVFNTFEPAIRKRNLVNLLSDQRVAQTLSLMSQPRDASLTPELAREVCRRTAGAAVLSGVIAQIGARYLLTLKAINCANGESLASTEAQAKDKDHVLDALGKVASDIRSKLGESLASVRKYDAPPENVTTPSLEALQAYSLGYVAAVVRGNGVAAVPLFQRAISLDDNFAMAFARLGTIYFNSDEPVRAAENLRKAYALRERVSEREKLYIEAHQADIVTGDFEAARKVYELWTEIYPRDEVPLGNLGVIYSFFGDYDKALAAYRAARELNPGSGNIAGNIVHTLIQLNRPKESRAWAQQAQALHLLSPGVHASYYIIDFLEHNAQGMEREAAASMGQPGWEDSMLYDQSETAARHRARSPQDPAHQYHLSFDCRVGGAAVA